MNSEPQDRTTVSSQGQPAHRVYPSRVDAWLMLVLYASPALLLAFGVYLWVNQRSDEALVCLMISVAIALFNRLLTHPCRYTLTADTLNIRCGLLNQSIDLSRIQGAELSSSWLSGPALSLKRVRVRLDHGQRLLSPLDRERFVADLMAAVDAAKQGSAATTKTHEIP